MPALAVQTLAGDAANEALRRATNSADLAIPLCVTDATTNAASSSSHSAASRSHQNHAAAAAATAHGPPRPNIVSWQLWTTRCKTADEWVCTLAQALLGDAGCRGRHGETTLVPLRPLVARLPELARVVLAPALLDALKADGIGGGLPRDLAANLTALFDEALAGRAASSASSSSQQQQQQQRGWGGGGDGGRGGGGRSGRHPCFSSSSPASTPPALPLPSAHHMEAVATIVPVVVCLRARSLHARHARKSTPGSSLGSAAGGGGVHAHAWIDSLWLHVDLAKASAAAHAAGCPITALMLLEMSAEEERELLPHKILGDKALRRQYAEVSASLPAPDCARNVPTAGSMAGEVTWRVRCVCSR